jgi:fibronectin-binding autotransporter adhesin
MKSLNLTLRVLSSALAAFAAVWLVPSANAAPVTWGTPSNITGDTDVSIQGAALYAYDWANASETVNGVSFTGSGSTSGGGTNVGISVSPGSAGNTTGAYSSSSAPFSGLSTAYQDILVGGDYANSGSATFTVTLSNLVVGITYSVQVWVSDPRAGGQATRTEVASSVGGNDVTLAYCVGQQNGDAGQYAIGSFTADSTTQTFTLLGTDSSQINALQVRTISLLANYWGGYVNGNWDYTTANWGGGESFASFTNNFTSVNFSDSNDLGNVIINNSVTVQSGGVAIGTINFLNNSVNYTFLNTSGDLTGITGATAINKTGTGVVTLAGEETYTGSTTIGAGTLALGAGGSIADSANIIVATNATFDVSAAGGFSLGSSQTLTGSGSINGNINAAAGGQIIPGGAGTIGTLTFNNNLSLNNQTLVFDLNASTNDLIEVLGTLTNNGTVAIELNPLTPLSAGTYTLINYAALTGSGSFVLANATGNEALNVGASAVTVTVTSLVWVGDGVANNWDVQTTMNWSDAGTPTDFNQGDDVTFGNSGSHSPPINLTTTLLPGTVTVNASQNYTFAGNGEISGSASLTQAGSGTLILDNAGSNDFTGGITISGGALQAGINDTNGNLPIGSLADNATLIFDWSNSPTITSVISGTGVINQDGSGTTTLSGANTYSGGTTINNGTLQLDNANAAGSGPVLVNSALNLMAGGYYYSNSISGSGQINIVPANLVPANSDYAQFNGSLNIAATINVPVGPGYARVVTTAANGNASMLTINVTNGGQLYVQSVPAPPNNYIAANVSVSGVGNGEALGAIRVDPGAALTGTITLTGDATVSAFNGLGTISGTITDNGGDHGITITSTQTNRSNRINYSGIFGLYSGNTTIDVGSVLGLVSGAAIENSAAINISSNAMFDVSEDGVSSYPIPTGIGGAATTQMLAGTGENGIINGSITLGSGGSLGVAISSDGLPSLIMTGGTLTLADNPVIVTALSLPLTAGIYPLVTNGAAGTVAGDVSTSPLSFAGAGLGNGATASLVISNSMLYLVVSQPPPPPSPALFSSVSALPNNGGLQLVFTGSNGHNYSLLATTNVALPFNDWVTLATGSFLSLPVTNIDLQVTNYPQRFYTIVSQ